jgi:CheY-like chemotaxis protein
VKILVAEDEPVSAAVLEATLKGLGHDVTIAKNGADAWDAWLIAQSRVIISDWQMPELDGIDLCQRIRARRGDRYTYFILLTGRTGRESFLTAMDGGVDDFLTKPVDREELAARLQVASRILGLREEMHALQGLLPICMYCKRIRDDAGQYSSLERYVEQRSGAAFSHGVCPECYTKHVEPQLEGGGAG